MFYGFLIDLLQSTGYYQIYLQCYRILPDLIHNITGYNQFYFRNYGNFPHLVHYRECQLDNYMKSLKINK